MSKSVKKRQKRSIRKCVEKLALIHEKKIELESNIAN